MRGAKLALLISAAALSACTGGDYGREARGTEGALTRAWATIAEPRKDGLPESSLALTNEETHLRAVAAQLGAPKTGAEPFDPFRVSKLEAALGEREERADPAAYYANMRRSFPESPDAMVNAMAAHMNEDAAIAARLSGLAQDAAAADRARLAGLGQTGRGGELKRSELAVHTADVMARVDENGRAIDQAVETLKARIEGYKAALRRARADVPSAVGLEKAGAALSALERSAADLEKDAARHGAAMQALFVADPL
ncbi:hypothetical protein ACSHT0_05135 [Tepidicaulis sp. LMO-SS28]|uniref:hypothetical protein n=1 Tax=Tepidicaulis sp. LMO-SS28 TaxID=3447455 RepID=UPI003EE01B47